MTPGAGSPESKAADRVRRCFSPTGRLQRWPSRRSEQVLTAWVVWSLLPEDTRFSEIEISALLRSWHDYEDFALLRRELVDLGLMQRTPDGRVYRRTARQDMPEPARLIAESFP